MLAWIILCVCFQKFIRWSLRGWQMGIALKTRKKNENLSKSMNFLGYSIEMSCLTLSYVSCREQDGNHVSTKPIRFIGSLYCVSSVEQQSTCRHVAPLGHINLIPSQPGSLLFLLYTACLEWPTRQGHARIGEVNEVSCHHCGQINVWPAQCKISIHI